MAITTFVASQILTAAQMNAVQGNDYNQTVSTKTASYTLVAADKGTRIVMNVTGASTVTVNTSLFSAGDTLTIQNISATACTVTAGTATVSSAGPLAIPQNGSGLLYFTSAGVSIFYPTAVTASASASGLTLISATTIPATSSTVAVSSCFSATYDTYKIVIAGGLGSTGLHLTCQLGAVTTGYYAGYTSVSYIGASGTSTSDNNAAKFTKIGCASANVMQASFELANPFLAKNTVISGINDNEVSTTSNIFAGFLNGTDIFTGFTIGTSTGTISGGKILVFGYQNS